MCTLSELRKSYYSRFKNQVFSI